MRACLNCCGSVMLAIASGNEFQSFIVRGKQENDHSDHTTTD